MPDASNARLSARQCRMVLSALPDLGPISIRRLEEGFAGKLDEVFSAPDALLKEVVGSRRAETIRNWRKSFDLQREEAECLRLGVRYVSDSDPDYPKNLKQIPDAPVGLYWRGPLKLESPAIAVVGTRYATAYGRKVTRQLVGDLVDSGFTIVSGMADGIDGEAHRTALDKGGSTIAVLGNGVDVVYPRKHTGLYAGLCEKGAVVSEFYLGRTADRQTFPQRNRIVSGMTLATLVVESAAKGGSLITAKFAMEQGRTVFAVPGRVDQPSSRGCLDLIRDGATLVSSAQDVIEELRFMQLDLPLSDSGDESGGKGPGSRSVASLGADERRCLELFEVGEQLHPDQICEATGWPTYQVHATLMMLELQRWVVKLPDGRFERA